MNSTASYSGVQHNCMVQEHAAVCYITVIHTVDAISITMWG